MAMARIGSPTPLICALAVGASCGSRLLDVRRIRVRGLQTNLLNPLLEVVADVIRRAYRCMLVQAHFCQLELGESNPCTAGASRDRIQSHGSHVNEGDAGRYVNIRFF